MANLYKRALEKIKTYKLRNYNFRLLLWLIAINILGVSVIASATPLSIYEQKQVLGLAIGSVAMIILTLIDYNYVLKFYWLIYVFNLLLLMLVKLVGANHMGAQRWIDIGFVQI